MPLGVFFKKKKFKVFIDKSKTVNLIPKFFDDKYSHF